MCVACAVRTCRERRTSAYTRHKDGSVRVPFGKDSMAREASFTTDCSVFIWFGVMDLIGNISDH